MIWAKNSYCASSKQLKLLCMPVGEPLPKRVCNILLRHDHSPVRPHAADDQHAMQLVQLVLKIWHPSPTPDSIAKEGQIRFRDTSVGLGELLGEGREKG